MDLEYEVRRTISIQLDKDYDLVGTEHTLINDLGADSLDIVELVMTFEDMFEMDIPDEDAQAIQTVGDMIEYLKEYS